MDVYATVDDLTDWLDLQCSPGQDALSRYLRYATIVVGRACYRNLYSGDTSFPQPLIDATCAQVASWVSLGTDPAKLGLDKAPVKKSSILSADVERDTTGLLAAYQEAVACLCPVSMDILVTQNLLWQAVPEFDASGALPHWGQDDRRPFVGEIANELDWPFI